MSGVLIQRVMHTFKSPIVRTCNKIEIYKNTKIKKTSPTISVLIFVIFLDLDLDFKIFSPVLMLMRRDVT